MARFDRVPGAEKTAPESRLDALINAINTKLSRVNQRLDLYIVEGTHEVAARIIDTQSNEVVKEIPPSDVLELRSRLDQMIGLLFDESA